MLPAYVCSELTVGEMSNAFPFAAEQLRSLGYWICQPVLSHCEMGEAITQISRLESSGYQRVAAGGTYAIRNLFEAVPALRTLALHPNLMGFARAVLGQSARPVRGIFFDKVPQANWKVPWHQDLTISVDQRTNLCGYGPWSVKAGGVHVQPPVAVLEGMLTLRLHLDPCDASNGPLRVLPGSHLGGQWSAQDITAWRQRVEPVECHVAAGGFVAMKPLLLHSSSAATTPRHRRVVHVEYSAERLPGGLNWREELLSSGLA